MTYKQIKVINNPYNDEQIKEKKDLIKNKINEFDKKIVSQDEMAIYLNDKPSNGWSEKGKDCIIKSKKQLIKTRFSISMTIDIDANINFTLKKGSMKQDDFIGLLTKLNKKYLKNKIIFLDNARIHKSKKAINYLEKNKINYIFNIPYHSHLNPIEYVFSLLRKKLLSSDVENEKDIIKVLVEFKKEIIKEHVKNIFNKCLKEIYN